jgi:hypothetical protein
MDSGGQAVLKVRWMLIDPESDKVLVVRESGYQAQAKGDDPAAGVEALSRVVGDFSREVADSVRARVPLPASTGGGGD